MSRQRQILPLWRMLYQDDTAPVGGHLDALRHATVALVGSGVVPVSA